MQEIIHEIDPDFIVETGTYLGGGSLFYASVLEAMNSDGKVITVDISDQIDKKALNSQLFKKRVEFILGDSVGAETISAIEKKVKGRKVIVTLDSDHSKAHVLKELELYSPFVSVGSYMIVQDTNINGHPVYPGFGPGPWEAVEEFLKNNKNFEIDHSREKFLITFYPSGYLKRIK
jgi:cephalosporin hydroxylase